MNEWNVVLVVISLVGLFATVGKPILNLVEKITTLTASVNGLREDLNEAKTSNAFDHSDINKHLCRHDDALCDHENRIGKLEQKH